MSLLREGLQDLTHPRWLLCLEPACLVEYYSPEHVMVFGEPNVEFGMSRRPHDQLQLPGPGWHWDLVHPNGDALGSATDL